MCSVLRYKDIFLKDYSFHFANSTFTRTEKYALHSHDFYEFTIVEEGILRQNLNNQTEDLNKYSLCLIKPEDIHAVSSSPKSEKVRIFNLAITPELFEETLAFLDFDHKNNIASKSQFSRNEWLGIYTKIKRISKMYHSKDHFLKIYVKELIVDLLVFLLNLPDPEVQNIPLWLKNAHQEMLEPKNYLIGLQRFIELSDRSQEHLNRSMKKYYRITPTVFINQHRLQFAGSLLSSSEKPIIEIIYDSGFENVSHFSRLFKKYYNLTPRQYRYKNKKIYNPD